MSDLGVSPVSTFPQYYSMTAYQNNQQSESDPTLNINPFVEPAENYNPPLSDLEGGAAGAFSFTPAACDCYGTNLMGDYVEEDASDDNYDYWPDAEVEPDEATVEDHYEDAPTEEAVDADGDSYPDEVEAEVETEVEADYFEDWTEEETGPSVCDNWPESVTITSPADGTIRVPYYTDSALNISYTFPNDPDEATAGDVVTCEVVIDGLATRGGLLADTAGILNFTPATPAEYFACATDYYARVRCFDSCTTESHEVVSAPVRFTTGPTVEWTRTYNGGGSGIDKGYGIALGPSGNIYVIGATQAGTERWQINTWLRGYDNNGNALWTQSFDYPVVDRDDYGFDVVTDDTENVYGIGNVNIGRNPMFGEDRDVWIGGYQSDGTPIFTTFYDTPGSIMFDYDKGYGIAVDNLTGDILGMGGASLSDTEQSVFWLGRYFNSGAENWALTDTGIGSGNDIAIDNSGRMYTIGNVRAAGGDSDIWIRAHNSDGSQIWTQYYNDPANGDDFGEGITTDSSGNIYVTGVEYSGSGIYQPWTAMYNNTGRFVWDQAVGRNGIATDDLGNVYVTGGSPSWSPATTSNTTRIDPVDGEIVCEILEDPAISPAGIVVDNAGNVYLAGSESVPGEENNIWVRKYSGF
ncbi:SBBP repeat-containing protein [Candidatus Saganbacteria bacterium]|nr:SBBP repeat-containing protein [Candidatus Saganbacteria bacterium]